MGEPQAKLSLSLAQEPTLDQIRPKTRILFIDDEKFAVVENLIAHGWTQTKRIKDIDNMNHPDITGTDIFFVDIQGVGIKMRFDDEGLGLARALKNTFPAKVVILYSAQKDGDRFDKTLSIVDDKIRKNADTYEFVQITERWAKEIFSPSQAIERIQYIIKKESGKNVSLEAIHNALEGPFSKTAQPDTLSNALDISAKTADIIASIVTIFNSKP